MSPIGKLRAWLSQRRHIREIHRKHQRRFKKWLARNPGGSYGEFYAVEMRRRIARGDAHANLGISNQDHAQMRARAQRVLADFRRAGCLPHHVVVDYGCGSLWVGEAFMEYLAPGNYIGLDVTDEFFAEALARMPAAFVADRKPTVCAISDKALDNVRDRKPDFILSTAVLLHVPPRDLAGYFARLLSLAGPGTRIELTHDAGWWSRQMPPRRWRHGRLAIKRALAPLGYTALYDARHRIMKSNDGLTIVRK